ncbi:hypothetical protein [Cyanobium sp. Morenito 9A2]|uniref:hypothetical protein n=1 Tax=Cyanobium sp. Morenito 9A2 TaxID=2823718 RepID=UPI0020CDEA33|nr:hypothetical protein [Cyanobium sp. Morenito 9A2]MCP9848841.1 hypothetical protein [Cyanobium sp. Morenito 9A2]
MSDPFSPGKRPVCKVCGGNGVLRINHHRFRTCLDCLGLGVLPVYDSHPALSRLLEQQAHGGRIKPQHTAEPTFVNAAVVSVSSR